MQVYVWISQDFESQGEFKAPKSFIISALVKYEGFYAVAQCYFVVIYFSVDFRKQRNYFQTV